MDREKWELLSASSVVLLPSRWKVLWQYVILGRNPLFTLSAWFYPEGGYMADMKLVVSFRYFDNAQEDCNSNE